MKKYVSFLGIVVLPFLFYCCDYTEALLKDGEVIHKEEKTGTVKSIEIETSVHLILTNDTVSTAYIDGLDFVVSRLNLSMEGNRLIIGSNGFLGFREKQMPSVSIGVKNLERIISNFPAKISSKDTIMIDNLHVVVNGRGSFTECNLTVDVGKLSLSAYGGNVGKHVLKGDAGQLVVVSEGLTSVDALQLNADDVKYIQKSVNPGWVNAKKTLQVNMYSSGNIYYEGQPKTNILMEDPLYQVTLGEVIPFNE